MSLNRGIRAMCCCAIVFISLVSILKLCHDFHDPFFCNVKIIEKNPESKEFKVYWNAPTFQCKSHKIFFSSLAEKYNVVQNFNDSFKGEKMTILYDPGNFPAILKDSNGNQFLRNGGVPQEGNLINHLQHLEERIKVDIPTENYNGIAVIDFESWRPVYRQNWAALEPYKTLSVNIEKQRHPFWTDAQLKKEAARRFEKSGRTYVEDTLVLAKALRPNATWGYYAYPYCFNLVATNNESQCSDVVKDENDGIMWLFENSDSLHPSLYLPQNRLNPQSRVELIEGRIMESQRINKQLNNEKMIIPYFWYNYQDTTKFLSEEDLRNSLIALKSFGIDGMIIWGSSNDVNTKAKCEALYKYYDSILGPLLVST